jgi:NAD(P)-dependent dehydrogenase (short-subunit alcohol dehydrogenase family)
MADQSKYISKLRDTRILVIGGSSGIGFTVAEACTEHGALVTISSSNKDRVSKAVEKLKSSYPSAKDKVFGLTVDLSKAGTLENELKTLLDDTTEKMGGEKLDHVIFTAGDALAMIKLEDMVCSVATYCDCFEVSTNMPPQTMQKIAQAGQIRFFAPLLLAKFLPQYLNSSYKSSYIITTGAVSEKPMANWTVIGSFAGALHSMVRNLALDMKPIRVNGVSPGLVDTELWRLPEEAREQTMKAMSQNMATARPGHPEDVAETYLGIMKDYNMDGSMVSTNGGSLIM